MQYPGKLPSICTSMDSSVDPSGSLSITLSPSVEKPSKIPGNNGEKHMVNYLHKIPVKSPSVHTPYSTSVIAPVHAFSVPSICTLYIPSIYTLYSSSVIAPEHALSVEHICASCIMSVIAPISALPILSVHLTNRQEFPDKFPGTNYGENLPSEIMAKFLDDITLTLHQAKFLEETLGTTNGAICPVNFLVT